MITSRDIGQFMLGLRWSDEIVRCGGLGRFQMFCLQKRKRLKIKFWCMMINEELWKNVHEFLGMKVRFKKTKFASTATNRQSLTQQISEYDRSRTVRRRRKRSWRGALSSRAAYRKLRFLIDVIFATTIPRRDLVLRSARWSGYATSRDLEGYHEQRKKGVQVVTDVDLG